MTDSVSGLRRSALGERLAPTSERRAPIAVAVLGCAVALAPTQTSRDVLSNR